MVSPLSRATFPFQMAFVWLINGGWSDHHLRPSWEPILQVLVLRVAIIIYLYQGNPSYPPPKATPPQEIAGLIKGLLTIGSPRNKAGY